MASLIEKDANYGKNDVFYEARGRYHMFFTCNTWANNALKKSGLPAALWAPFDKGIFYQYRNYYASSNASFKN